jgi:hypothetical protein
MPGKPPHCMPGPTAIALVGIEINTSTDASETNSPAFMIVSLFAVKQSEITY